MEDPNEPEEPHWIQLGTSEVRHYEEEPLINIPDTLDQYGILDRVENGERDSDPKERYAHWAYEETNEWILIANQELRGIPREGIYYNGNKRYKIRQKGRIRIPNMLFSTVESIEASKNTTDQVVPEGVQMQEGEKRYFMTWSEWLNNDPKPAVLMRWDQLPYHGPDKTDGLGGGGGPRFGASSGDLPEPDIGLSN